MDEADLIEVLLAEINESVDHLDDEQRLSLATALQNILAQIDHLPPTLPSGRRSTYSN